MIRSFPNPTVMRAGLFNLFQGNSNSTFRRLNNPVSVTREQRLNRVTLSIDRSQFGRAEITVDFMNCFAIIQL